MPLLTWDDAQPYLDAPKPSCRTLELEKWHYARTLAAIEEAKSALYLSEEQKAKRIEEWSWLLTMIEEYAVKFQADET